MPLEVLSFLLPKPWQCLRKQLSAQASASENALLIIVHMKCPQTSSTRHNTGPTWSWAK